MKSVVFDVPRCGGASLSGRRSVQAERRSFWLAVASWVDAVGRADFFDDDDPAGGRLEGLDVFGPQEFKRFGGLLEFFLGLCAFDREEQAGVRVG